MGAPIANSYARLSRSNTVIYADKPPIMGDPDAVERVLDSAIDDYEEKKFKFTKEELTKALGILRGRFAI